jgi:hypothetical protein
VDMFLLVIHEPSQTVQPRSPAAVSSSGLWAGLPRELRLSGVRVGFLGEDQGHEDEREHAHDENHDPIIGVAD